MTLSDRLRRYNRWRRGDARIKQPDPTALGELIDAAADRLEVLEREHRDHFDQWHAERRRREKLLSDIERCYLMLLSEPDTPAALMNTESILREAIVEAKITTAEALKEKE